jgi:type III pantothenate kinase
VILDVDLGNTRIKWRSSEKPEVISIFAFGDELPSLWSSLACSDRMRLASVLKPEKTATFVESVRRHSGVSIQIAQVQQHFAGLQLAYADASHFGVDRWLALLAARARFSGRDCIVVSGGTALTVDWVTAGGVHLGGYIAPGWRAAAQALWQNADGLDDARRGFAPRLQPGATTLECVAAGLTLLFRGFAVALCQQVDRELVTPQWIFTGGDAEVLLQLFAETAEAVQIPAQLAPGLVLEGLVIALP